jgi:signal recognition particle GTPase
MNFAVALVGNRVNGTRVDVARFVSSESVKDHDRLLEQLIAVLIHSDVSRETRDNLSRVLNEQRAKLTPAKYDDNTARKNAEQVVSGLASLILGAREFQVK